MAPSKTSKKSATSSKRVRDQLSASPYQLQHATAYARFPRHQTATRRSRARKAGEDKVSEDEEESGGSEEGEELREGTEMMRKESQEKQDEELHEEEVETIRDDQVLGATQLPVVHNSNNGNHDEDEVSNLPLAKRRRQGPETAPERPTTPTPLIIYGPSLWEEEPLTPRTSLQNLVMDPARLDEIAEYCEEPDRSENDPPTPRGKAYNNGFDDERTGYLKQIADLKAKVTSHEKALDEQVAKFNKCETALNDYKNLEKSHGTRVKWNKNAYLSESTFDIDGEEAREAILAAQRLRKVDSQNSNLRQRILDLESELEVAQQGRREAESLLAAAQEGRQEGDTLVEMMKNGYSLWAPTPHTNCDWKAIMEDYRQKHKK